MIMLKDNHIDYCGGIEKAINKAYDYLQSKKIDPFTAGDKLSKSLIK